MPKLKVIEKYDVDFQETAEFTYRDKKTGEAITVESMPARKATMCLCHSDEEGITFPVELPSGFNARDIKPNDILDLAVPSWAKIIAIPCRAQHVKRHIPAKAN